MRIKFYIEQPKRNRSPLSVIVTFKKKRYKKSTGISILTSKWDKTEQRCKTSKDYKEGVQINYQLTDIHQEVSHFFRQHEIAGTTPSLEEFKCNKQKKNANTLISDLIDERVKSNNFDKSTNNNYIQTKTHLNNYNRNLNINNIDLDFYYNFKNWFFKQTYKKHKDGPKVHYSINTFGTIIKILKSTLNNLPKDLRVTIDQDIHDKNFKITEETADTVYLSVEELQRIHNLGPTIEEVKTIVNTKETHNLISKKQALKTAKNWFLLGAYTALRVSDFSRLSDHNIKEKFIIIKPKKGKGKNEDLYIPIHPIVKEILQDPTFDIYKPISDQKINKQIKDVCKLAKINDPISHSRTEGGKLIERIDPKYKLITNHTARRSAATNMFKAGIPALNIMKITGHRTESSFMKYIKISQEENAILMSQHQFFK